MPIDQLTRIGSPRPIVRWDDALLHEASCPVRDFDEDLQLLLADMFATNRAARGAGLAAPQVGVALSVFVYDCADADLQRRVGVICNPVLDLPEGAARRLETWEEGCLSLPGGYAELARPTSAVCHGQDQYGDPVEIRGTGLLARCHQHETDHLHGVVFGDRLPGRRRRELFETHRRAAHRYPPHWPVAAGDRS